MSFLDTMSVIGSILMIIGVIFLTYYASRWYARRLGGGAGQFMKVVDRMGLGRTSALMIVAVGDKYYLIGVSEKSIQLLSELDEPPSSLKDVVSDPSPSFAALLGGLMGKQKDPQKNQDDGGPE